MAGFTLVELVVALFITAIMFTIGYRALDQAFRSRKEVDEQSARLIAVQQALRTIEQDFELLQPRPVRNLVGDGYLPAIQSSANAGSMLGSTNSTFADSSTNSSTGSNSNSNSNSSNSSNSNNSNSSSSASSNSTTIMTSPTLGNVSTLNGAALPLVSFTRGGWTNPAGLPRSELQRVSYSIENGALMRSYTPELDATLADVPIKRTLVDHVKSFSLRFMDAGHNWQTQWPVLTTVATGQEDMTLRWRPVAVEVTIELEDWGILMRHIEVAG
jgi:prepilin-type N-terminal cleavage/methylation domain-containing protein